MPREELADIPWVVVFRDGHRIEVSAAYPSNSEVSLSATTPPNTEVMWLKNASHKVVFAAPLDEILYARRVDTRTAPGDPPADDWGPCRYRVMRLSRDWSDPWRGMNLRLGAFGGVNDDAYAVIEVKREGDEPEADL